MEEAKARAFREERFRERAAAFKQRVKLLSQVSGIVSFVYDWGMAFFKFT